MPKKIKDRKQEFIKLVASGTAPYKACIEAGYSETYANTYSHKLLGKYKEEIEALKPKAQKKASEEVAYKIEDAIKECKIAQEVAMTMQNPNVSAYLKAVELKGKLLGLFQADNEQKANSFEINVNRKSVDVKGND